MRHCLRPLLSTLLVSSTVISIGCTSSADEPELPADQQRVSVKPLPEAAALRFYSGMTSRERLVVRDQTTWASVWPQIAGAVQPAPALPKVDFASDVVIVAAMGMKSTGGYSISVDAVIVAAGEASISILEESPGAMCGVTGSLTAPLAVVVVPRFPGKASWVEHASVRDCN